MAEKSNNDDNKVKKTEFANEDTRRSFIVKTSLGGAATVGAILGMTEEASAQRSTARPAADAKNANTEKLILSRATMDSSFRKQLIADPRKVIAAEMGMTLRDDLQITVLEENMNTVYIVLPFIAPEEQINLSNADLGTGVAGLGAKPKSKHHCKCSSLSVCGSK